MKKTLKLMAMFFGVITLLTGANSCKEDEKNECCSVNLTFEDEFDSEEEMHLSIKICKDGEVLVKEDGEIVDESDWTDYFDNWFEVKSSLEEESGKDCK